MLPIGAVAERTGLAVSAIRFYEEQGLVSSTRAESGHRRFHRSTIRRLSFVRICQKLGYSLDDIRSQLDSLPAARTPTESDWERLAERFTHDLDERIAGLTALRERVAGCIGCGCLSLSHCNIYNVDDVAAEHGDGPRYLLGNRPSV